MTGLKEKNIAVVGVSDSEEKYGFKIFRDFVKTGHKVEGVNPRGGNVLGKVIFKSLKDIAMPIDLVVTVVPPPATDKIVDECLALGVKEIWMQPGSESRAAIEKAEKSGIKVTANACIMVTSGIW